MIVNLSFIIFLPLITFILEIIVSRNSGRLSGIMSKTGSFLTFLLAVLFAVNFIPSSSSPQFLEYHLWVPDWGISYKLGLDGFNSLILVLMSFSFFLISILSGREQKGYLFYSLLMVIESSALGFVISYDLVLKIIFWEIIWIPLFLLLNKYEKQKIGIAFSKVWFFSEIIIVISCVLLFNNLTNTYDLETIISGSSTKGRFSDLIFFLFVTGIIIRAGLFPFDKWLTDCIKSCSISISFIVALILPVLSIVFYTQLIITFFSTQTIMYLQILCIIFYSNLIVVVFRLMFNKSIPNIITSTVIMYNSLLLLWLSYPKEVLIQAALEVFIIKFCLSVIILYFGKILHQESRIYGLKNMIIISPVNSWLFIISVVFLFGIPGLVMAKPVFVLISSWYGIIPYISFLLLVLLIISFVLTSLNLSPVFITQAINTKKCSTDYIGSITLFIVLVIIIVLSMTPEYIHRFSSNYFNNFLMNRGY